MTRGEWKQRLRNEMRFTGEQYLDSAPWEMDRLAVEATDYVAFRTKCLYAQRTTALVAGQAVYTMPGLFNLRTMCTRDSHGDYWTLGHSTPREMDLRAGALWRTQGTDDPPRIAVMNGVNSVTLYPTPSASRDEGVLFEGYYKPGDNWVWSGGAGQAITDATENPLPEWAQEAWYLYSLLRATEQDDRPPVQALYALRERRFRAELGEVVAQAERFHRLAGYRGLGSWYTSRGSLR